MKTKTMNSINKFKNNPTLNQSNRNKTLHFAVFSILLVTIGSIFSCSNTPVLSELANSRLQLVFKGTYESNNPHPWKPIHSNDSLIGQPGSINTTGTPYNFSDLNFYLDIADIRLATGTGLPANTKPADYWTYFTKERKLFCSTHYALLNYPLNGCIEGNGQQSLTDFFNEGYLYPTSDLEAKTYSHVAIFFRKMVVNKAIKYDAAGNITGNISTMFDNRSVNGIDLGSKILQVKPGTSTINGITDPLISPLERTDLQITIPDTELPYVLEVRVFIKNLLMNHVIQYGDGTLSGLPVTFVGPSDWNANHQFDNVDNAFKMGGNMVFYARVYQPEKSGNIVITDAGVNTTNLVYYAVMPAGTTFPTNGLPYAATSVQGAGDKITNLPEGLYDVYKTCDIQYRTAAGLAIGQDGFPEKIVSCQTGVNVQAGQNTAVTLTCNCN